MRAPATGPRAQIVPRGGFGTVGPKLSEDPVSISYFGASVTAQKDGYRPLLHDRLRDRFRQDHRSSFAGIGGVDVVSAVFLADEFVARHRPDLCLIEFTSTELIWGSSVAEAKGAMDGILAKLTAAGTRPCLLHLARREWHEQHTDVLAAFERAADRHGIPSIDLTGVFLESAGTDAAANRIFRDAVHITAAGAELASELIADAIESVAAQDPHRGTDWERPDPSSNEYRGAHVLAVVAEDAAGPARMCVLRLQRPYLEFPHGSSIRRRFEERLAGLVLLVGPDSGELEVVDRRGPQRLMIWDEYCHYERFTACLFERPCEAGGEVSIELTDTVPDYASCRRPMDPPERRTVKVIGYMVLPA